MDINLYILHEIGFGNLAQKLSGYLSQARRIEDWQAAELIRMAGQQLGLNRKRYAAGHVSEPWFHRVHYTIICGFHLLMDEFPMTDGSRKVISSFLANPDLKLPEHLDGILPNGCVVSCKMDDYLQFVTWFYGVYEPSESHLFNSLVEPGMVVVDAGANIGQYTLLAATRVGPQGHVHSFEPYQPNFSALTTHVYNNRLAECCRLNYCALWNRDGRLSLFPPRSEPRRSYKTNSGAFRVHESLQEDIDSTACIGLDAYLEQAGVDRLDLIKIDVEGAELHVLQGAQFALNKWKPLLLMEVNGDALASQGKTVAELFGFMDSLGCRRTALGEQPSEANTRIHGNFVFYAGRRPAALDNKLLPEDSLRWALSGRAAMNNMAKG
jgi:FkbM family methyltransferase